jgi:hypothetical protein
MGALLITLAQLREDPALAVFKWSLSSEAGKVLHVPVPPTRTGPAVPAKPPRLRGLCATELGMRVHPAGAAEPSVCGRCAAIARWLLLSPEGRS